MMNLEGQTRNNWVNPIGRRRSYRWILSRYHQVVRQTSNYIDHYGLGEAAKGLYDLG